MGDRFESFCANLKVALFIKSDGTQWAYAGGRTTGAEVVAVTFD